METMFQPPQPPPEKVKSIRSPLRLYTSTSTRGPHARQKERKERVKKEKKKANDGREEKQKRKKKQRGRRRRRTPPCAAREGGRLCKG
ncbi:hypothetical protein TESG_08625 [Trichophyton tonsurans CBS 112818]|uniref:Uncharacterized protein n=1 Tax=Trichophyton tonsurans (strain CBS 112818) TaxID=647933 RepID=F2S8X5_TRIT1|nr:hypothetical protein TESG_08625 [Trichophyton tonsurans CBS 112818]